MPQMYTHIWEGNCVRLGGDCISRFDCTYLFTIKYYLECTQVNHVQLPEGITLVLHIIKFELTVNMIHFGHFEYRHIPEYVIFLYSVVLAAIIMSHDTTTVGTFNYLQPGPQYMFLQNYGFYSVQFCVTFHTLRLVTVQWLARSTLLHTHLHIH